jgi:RNA-directed DNA polymerase
MKRIHAVSELATILGTTEGHLFHLIRKREKLYKYDCIQKPNGGKREFYKPKPPLKIIQRAIDQIILTKFSVNSLVYGFVKGRSIWKCAQALVGCRCLLWFDIHAFFPSTTSKRVSDFFSQLSCPQVSNILTELTTWKNQLPQGPPTSPRLSNLVNSSLDNRLGGLASAHNLKVARYGDDIYFGGERWIPSLQKTVVRIVEEEGYIINKEKISAGGIQVSSQPQIVLSSLVVNSHVGITSDYYDEVWAKLKCVQRLGWEEAISNGIVKSQASLRGKIGHVQRASAAKGNKLMRMYQHLA